MSRFALIASFVIILLVHFLFYPKWKMSGTSATISWDVSGYYLYLPAAFIYKDLKQVKFKDTVLKKYKPQPGFAQAFKHEESGNYVMKYSIGQAITYSPFFFIGHAWALNSNAYPPDGFSRPYQFMIAMGMLLWTLIGLIYLRKSLIIYFEDKIVAFSLLGIVLGSNYLNYVAIDGAMTHNTVFTLYALLIYLSILFHQAPSWSKAFGIGAIIGLASLIRPTEAISCLIPLLWGLDLTKKEPIMYRLSFLKTHIVKLLVAVLVTAALGFIQLAYWKYATGDWIVYSYQDQGFSWLKPHLFNGILSYRSGWLVYSPFMVFSLIGFVFLYKQNRKLFFSTFIFSMLFIYIAFAWDIWWYGGSLGQRTMVQAYPLLIFPICAFFSAMFNWRRNWLKVAVGLIVALFVYASLWFTYQAHYGGMVKVSQMNKAYFWKTLLTYQTDIQNLKLLDNCKELFDGERKNVQSAYSVSNQYAVLDKEHQFSEKVIISAADLAPNYNWIRISADIYFEHKEYNPWEMTQFVVHLKSGDQMVKQAMYRVQRITEAEEDQEIYLDISKPEEPFESLELFFWNSEGKNKIEINNLKVESFEE